MLFLAQLKIYVYFCISKANNAYYQWIAISFRFGRNKGNIKQKYGKPKEKFILFLSFFGVKNVFRSIMQEKPIIRFFEEK